MRCLRRGVWFARGVSRAMGGWALLREVPAQRNEALHLEGRQLAERFAGEKLDKIEFLAGDAPARGGTTRGIAELDRTPYGEAANDA